jgi:hypothetical protein
MVLLLQISLGPLLSGGSFLGNNSLGSLNLSGLSNFASTNSLGLLLPDEARKQQHGHHQGQEAKHHRHDHHPGTHSHCSASLDIHPDLCTGCVRQLF